MRVELEPSLVCPEGRRLRRTCLGTRRISRIGSNRQELGTLFFLHLTSYNLRVALPATSSLQVT